jgi:threonine aldolase
MYFTSDNAAPAHPAIMDAMLRANTGYTSGYGGEDAMADVQQTIRDLFEAPDAAVYLVSTGTAANALALATMTKPWETIFCHRNAHIEEDECGAPEFYANGAKLTLVEGADAMMTPNSLQTAIDYTARLGVHNVQHGSLSITNVTEVGTVYSLEKIQTLTKIAHASGVKTHLDGARFANAMVALDCTPAELTWKSGIDAVSFGGTKNGCLGVEAVIFFDPDMAWEFELRRKRGGHLISKHRMLSAQMQGYLADGLWIDLAKHANAMGQNLAAGLAKTSEVEFMHPTHANMVFAQWSRATHDKLAAQGSHYYFWPADPAPKGPADELLSARLVCNWSTTDAEIDQFLGNFT